MRFETNVIKHKLHWMKLKLFLQFQFQSASGRGYFGWKPFEPLELCTLDKNCCKMKLDRFDVVNGLEHIYRTRPLLISAWVRVWIVIIA